MTEPSSILLVFGREPVPGKTKTRLGRTLGMDTACELYCQMLSYVLEMSREVSNERRLYLPAGDVVQGERFALEGWTQHPQVSGDIGARMKGAFEEAFAAGAERAVLVGSDIPSLTADILERAFAALDEAEMVFGPARDGGYYLIGQRAPSRNVYDNITWSTAEVWSQTEAHLQTQGISYAVVDVLDDLDDEDALHRYLTEGGPCPLALPEKLSD